MPGGGTVEGGKLQKKTCYLGEDEIRSQNSLRAAVSAMINQLVQQLGSQVIVSGFAEDIDKADMWRQLQPRRRAACTRCGSMAPPCAGIHSKSQALISSGRRVDVVVGVDTVVESAGLILEKPNDADHALRMLQSLSGGRHQVHTGVVFKFMNGSSHSFHETTCIDFAIVPTEALQAYVQSGEPMDKAGGFGIQGAAAAFISGINGCYYNVMGLPLHKFCAELSRFLHASEGALAVTPPAFPESESK